MVRGVFWDEQPWSDCPDHGTQMDHFITIFLSPSLGCFEFSSTTVLANQSLWYNYNLNDNISFLKAEHYHNFAIPPNQKIDSKFDKSSIMIYDSKSFLSDEALRNDLYSFTDKENNSSEILKSPRLSLLDTLDFFNFYKECKPWQSLSKCKTEGQNYISG